MTDVPSITDGRADLEPQQDLDPGQRPLEPEAVPFLDRIADEPISVGPPEPVEPTPRTRVLPGSTPDEDSASESLNSRRRRGFDPSIVRLAPDRPSRPIQVPDLHEALRALEPSVDDEDGAGWPVPVKSHRPGDGVVNLAPPGLDGADDFGWDNGVGGIGSM